MKIVVHYPKDKHELDALSERVAKAHGDFIYSYLHCLNCSVQEKLRIIENIERMN